MQLTSIPGGAGEGTMTVRQVFEQIDDLVRDALPNIPLGAPGRESLVAFSPQMSRELGRSPARLVNDPGTVA